MGQYYTIFNKTKKEFIGTHSMCSGAKLLEFGCGGLASTGLVVLLANSNGRGGGDLNAPIKYTKDYKEAKRQPAEFKAMQNAVNEVAGRWAGDEIVIQGDYAGPDDPAFIDTEEEMESYKDISALVLKALSVDRWLAEKIESDYFGKEYGKGCFSSTATRD